MPKYGLFFTYTSDAWDAMVEKPRDRAAQGLTNHLLAGFLFARISE